MTRDDLRIAIIGAGPGGLCAGKRLLDEGYTNFVILERAEGVGGTWRRNRYPGCECDVPSALYSFSFDIKPDWSKPYGTQPEILTYMEDLAAKFDLLEHCRFGAGVRTASWSDDDSIWTLTLDSGATVEAEVVVGAVGMFGDLVWPTIDGIDTFAGTIFHSGAWDWEHDFAGERVAVIGSAASAVQFVPELADMAGHLTVFQRTANWVLPKVDAPYTPEQLDAFRSDPARVAKFRALVHDNIDRTMTFADSEFCAEREATGLAALDVVADDDTREHLRPRHPYGSKRPLASNRYYPTFNRPDVELVTEAIDHVTTASVVTTDGVERSFDAIVVATGFTVTKYLAVLDVTGRNGLRLDDAWSDGPQAHLGITAAGFPNLFMLYGPNTNNGSILTMIEYQVDHVLAHLARLSTDAAWVEVTPAAVERHNDDVQSAIADVRVWNQDVNGYYWAESGRNVTQWPFSMTEYQRRASTIVDGDFVYGPRR